MQGWCQMMPVLIRWCHPLPHPTLNPKPCRSFNGALAAPPGGGDMGQWACVANTVLALIASCIASFVASAYYDGKFNMVHVQNATLAGGVAIGSSANLRLPPAAALTVGALAGG